MEASPPSIPVWVMPRGGYSTVPGDEEASLSGDEGPTSTAAAAGGGGASSVPVSTLLREQAHARQAQQQQMQQMQLQMQQALAAATQPSSAPGSNRHNGEEGMPLPQPAPPPPVAPIGVVVRRWFASVPPTTLVVLAVIVTLLVLDELLDLHLQQLCLSFNLVASGNVPLARFFASPFIHMGLLHLAFNSMAWMGMGRRMERRLGTMHLLLLVPLLAWQTAGLYLFMGFLTSVPPLSLAIQDASSSCAVGFSAVLFTIMVLEAFAVPNHMANFCGARVPSRVLPWVSLIFIQIIMPGVSLMGHLSGMLVGYAHVSKAGVLLRPPAVLVRAVENTRLVRWVTDRYPAYVRHDETLATADVDDSAAVTAGNGLIIQHDDQQQQQQQMQQQQQQQQTSPEHPAVPPAGHHNHGFAMPGVVPPPTNPAMYTPTTHAHTHNNTHHNTDASAPPPYQPAPPPSPGVSRLMEMGFAQERAQAALDRHAGNVDAAAEELLYN